MATEMLNAYFCQKSELFATHGVSHSRKNYQSLNHQKNQQSLNHQKNQHWN